MSTDIRKYTPTVSTSVEAIQLTKDMSNWKCVCEFMGYPAKDEESEMPEFLFCNCSGSLVDVLPGDFVVKKPAGMYNVLSEEYFHEQYQEAN